MYPEIVFSNEESKKIEELRKRMKNEVKSEVYEDKMMFYRFLKARNFNINHAEAMLRKHLKWREENRIDTILEDYKPNEVMEKYLPLSFLGYDKEGCTVRYFAVGKIDTKGIYLSAKYSDFERRITYDIEQDMALLKDQTKKLGKIVDKCIYIHNYEGLTFAQVSNRKLIEDAMSYCRTYQDNYPERLKAVIGINASKYFQWGFSIVKTCLAGTVIDKVKIFGTDGWQEELLKCIDADQLPAFLGGTRTDPDGNPLCKTFINHGGIVPERYFIHKRKKSLSNLNGAKRAVLSRGSLHEETVLVEEPGSFIEWEFVTKVHDVGFGIFLQETVSGEVKRTEIVPIQRISTKEFANTGLYKCEESGKYVVVFDNTYSWMRSKELLFRVTVISSSDERNIESNGGVS